MAIKDIKSDINLLEKSIRSLMKSSPFDREISKDYKKQINSLFKKFISGGYLRIKDKKQRININEIHKKTLNDLDRLDCFIKKNGEFTVNIALVTKGIPVLGMVYCPVLKKLYYGSVKERSFLIEGIHYDNLGALNSLLNKAKLLPHTTYREIYTIFSSRSHSTSQTEKFIQSFKEKYGKINLTSIGSSLKLCLVAEGMADIYPRLGPTMEWDTAAAHAVVLYAGGSVTDYETDEPLTYNKENLLNPYFLVHN